MKLSVLFLIFSLGFLPLKAQTLIGFSADLGNRVGYESAYSSKWLSSPMSVSGTLYFLRQETMRDNFYIQYGAGLGVLGHKIRANETVDTIRVSNSVLSSHATFPNYHTIFGSFEIGLGKVFKLSKLSTLLATELSGGLTHYFISEFGNGFSRSSGFNNSDYTIFRTETSNSNGNFNAFMDIGIILIPYSRISIGLHYRYHFSEAFRGSYQYYHTPELSEGDVVVYHRILSLKIMYRVKL